MAAKKTAREARIARFLRKKQIGHLLEYSNREIDAQAAVITLMAVIDCGLERHLVARMRRLPASEFENIFSGTAPLASLSAKIRLSYALGIIGKTTRDDLMKMNRVRNTLAHTPIRTNKLDKTCMKIVQSLTIFSYLNTNLANRDARFIERWPFIAYAWFLTQDRPKRRAVIARSSTLFGWPDNVIHL